MQITITLRTLRHWQWGLLALLALALTLTGGAKRQPAEGAFPGANGKIAFASDRTGNFEVFVMNADGTDQANLSNNAFPDFEPAWSPDGTKIAFRSDRTGSAEVFVMNADGTGQTNLTNNAASDFEPAWSPDATKIAFWSDRSGNQEVFVMNADGTGQTNLTNNAASDFGPAWSPGGTQIAFWSDRTGNFEVFVMNADGTGPTNVTNNASADFDPAWSPDGAKIVFGSNRSGDSDVFAMNADGTGQLNLTNNAADDFEPAWSPDGAKIAFWSHRTGNFEVFAMNADGTSQINLSNRVAVDREPDWQPLPVPPEINITNVGQYALPKSCFSVRDALQNPLFVVCDNDFQGPPAAHAACAPDGVCNDEDPAQGLVRVTVAGGSFSVVESKPPPNHTADASKLVCDTALGKCALTFSNPPLNNPWFPWDINGDNAVTVGDIFVAVLHFGECKEPGPGGTGCQ